MLKKYRDKVIKHAREYYVETRGYAANHNQARRMTLFHLWTSMESHKSSRNNAANIYQHIKVLSRGWKNLKAVRGIIND
jgi:putative NADPH-quinone reductase